ncbi:MAG: Gfo/Idh/MocA family oxidoreductase [Candidatus Brocadiaceae bacterium]|jgi:predicted dehydrogenase
MPESYPIGILGCGDYLRWEHETIKRSERVRVKSLYDPASERAEKYAEFFGARAVASDDEVFGDAEIRAVLIFTPPFTHRDLVVRAAREGKHVITVKPLAPTVAEATDMVQAVRGAVDCAVFYRRTGNAVIETLKEVFSSGEIGGLGLFREDWLHHYPTWNRWATDPDKNGGPFMDAMIHNLNIARYLADSEPLSCTFFSDNHAQDLDCNDTESMKVDFESGAAAHLFITWAADLEIYDATRNDREHIDLWYMISDEGWYVTVEGGNIQASREGDVKTWPTEKMPRTPYDEFIEAVEAGAEQPFDVVDAWKDVKILEEGAAHPGRRVELDLTPPA